MQSRMDELEQLNQAMTDRDKLKDDAIAHLSDQLIALTARLDSIERRLFVVGVETVSTIPK
jgi:hypothetical protein